MGLAGVLLKFSLIVALLAAVIYMPAFRQHRQKLSELLNTCPLHWFRDQNTVDQAAVTKVIKTGQHPLFTKEELSLYDGTDGSKGVYIGIFGRVYDVSTGKQYYGPGGGYSFFSGRDGTRAFVTGQFNEEGLIDDASGFDSGRMLDLLNWVDFYEKTYHFVGKVIGNFYDAEGNPTQALLEAEAAVQKAVDEKKKSEEEAQIFPPCNSHWSEGTGTRVWCSTKSGGISRDWEGVPRKFFDPALPTTRCVCVRQTGSPSYEFIKDNDEGDLNHPNLRLYEGCERLSNSCVI